MRLKKSTSVLFLLLIQPCHAEFNVQNVALNCLTCHSSSEGGSENDIPNVTNLSTQELQQSLLDFKYDRLPATLMPRIAKAYSDEQLQQLADWLSSR
jgi:sulfide dehydrogenase cytochrome subunit